MHRETISILHARACKTIGRVLTVLVFSTAFLRPDLAIGRGFHGGGFSFAGPEARLETVIAQDPQHVLGNADGRVADKPHPVRTQIGKAADVIVKRPVGIEKDRTSGG